MAFVKTKVKSTTAVNVDERRLPRDCEHLKLQLGSESAFERRWAARDLVRCPDAAALLVNQLHIENDQSVREIVFTTLTFLGNDIAVAGLIDCLRSEDAAIRNEAIEAMKNLPDEVAPMMKSLLANPVADVRIFAVNILESLCHPLVESWLINVIEHDQHINVCSTAVDLLAEVGTQAALEPLTRLKKRYAHEPYIQFATDMAIKRIVAS